LARQIDRVTGFVNLKRGVTVNPGVISGGTRSNVVAAEAHAEVDIRVPKLRDAETLDRKFHALRSVDKRCNIEIEGGMNRPPMERSIGIVQLFRTARQTTDCGFCGHTEDQAEVSMGEGFRMERDTMGEMRVPTDALYGAQTARAVENFPISGMRFQRPFIRALALIKSEAARVNRE